MAQTVVITLTIAGADTGPFDLYSDADGYITPFEVGVSKVALEGGYVSVLVPDMATIIRVQSTSVLCDNFVDLPISPTTTTTTTTEAPTTSTTTTLVVLNFTVDRYSCGDCLFLSNEVLDAGDPVTIGKYYILSDNSIGHVTGYTASPVTFTLFSSTPHDTCGEILCP